MITTEQHAPEAVSDTTGTPTPLDVARQVRAHMGTPAEPKEGMFTPEQQAEIDRIIRDRIQRVEAKYADLDVGAAEQRLQEIKEQIRDGELKVLRNEIATRIGLSAKDRDLLLTGADATHLAQQEALLVAHGIGKPAGNIARREGQVVMSPPRDNEEMQQFLGDLFGHVD